MEVRRTHSGAPWEAQVGYCRALRAGDHIYVTGTAPVAADGGVFAPGDAYAQARRCFEIIGSALAELGADLSSIVRTRMFVTDIERWQEFGRAHAEFFAKHPPATTMVEIKALIDPAMLIEVEADAVCPGTGRTAPTDDSVARPARATGHRPMIEIEIPGSDALRLEHLVLDYNGTLATDGRLLPGVVDRLRRLGNQLEIHVVTAGTFGDVPDELRALPCAITVLRGGAEDVAKREHVKRLGSAACAAIGNGANDRLMLAEAGLGIAVIGDEGTSTQALLAADLVCTSATSALDLLAHPRRVTATLRR